MKCHHCGIDIPFTGEVVTRPTRVAHLFRVVVDDYCADCSRRIAQLYKPRVVRFARPKDLTPFGGAA